MKTTIQVSQETKNELRKHGIKDSTWDQIISDLLKHVETCDVWWNRG